MMNSQTEHCRHEMGCRVFWREASLLVCLLLIAFVARVIQLDLVPYWQDEAFSLHMAEFSCLDICRRSANDTHPPLFFVLLKAWVTAFGDQEWPARFFSTLWGVGAVAGAFAFVLEAHHSGNSRLRSRPLLAAALAGLFLALSPLHISWGQQVRMYAPVAFFSVVCTWTLWRAMECPTSLVRWAVFAVLETAAAYVHVTMYFVILAHAVTVLTIAAQSRLRGTEIRGLLKNGMMSFIVVAVGSLPWVFVVLQQHSRVSENFWIKPLTLDLLGEAFLQCFGIPKHPVDAPSAGLILAQFVFVCLLLVALKRTAFDLILAFTGAIPIIALVAMSMTGRNIVLAQYFIGPQAICLVALAVLIARISHGVPTMAVGLLISTGMALLAYEYHDIRASKGDEFALQTVQNRWRELAEPEEFLIHGNPMIFNVARFYNSERKHVRLYGSPAAYPFYMGTATLSPADGMSPKAVNELPNRFWLCDRVYRRSVMLPFELSAVWQLVAESAATDSTGTFVLKCYEKRKKPSNSKSQVSEHKHE